LPFYLSKRQEEARPSSSETDKLQLFKDLTGNDWSDFECLEMDAEEKITEFNYENYLNMDLITDEVTESQDFKKYIRLLNFTSKTKYEAHEKAKKQFSAFMSETAGLTDKERRVLIHLMKNKHGNVAAGQEVTESIIDQTVDDSDLIEIAKTSETEQYNIKNRYRHQR